MADDDPFADLGETLAEDPDGEDQESESESGASSTGGAVSEEPIEKRDPKTDSAFSYEAAKQRPFYAREQTIDEFDAWLNYELERELDQQGYQNIVVREMTDALLRTVVDEDLVPEVAQRFEQARETASEESPE